MLRPSNGNVKNEDGKYVFVGKVYGTKSIHEDPEKVQALLQIFPRLHAEELRTASDGVYTWLLYSVEGSDEVRFVCTEVVSPFEIGTRHQSMAYNSRIQASKLYGGGELRKKGDTIQFNLLSGTYSKPLAFNKSVTNTIVATFKTFFPKAEYDTSGDSYIPNVKTVSKKLLDIYETYGYTVRVFDTYYEWAAFQNMFWNLDFNIEHYSKKVATANDSDRPIMKTLYMDSLQRMTELLQKAKTRGGVRKTRKARRHRSHSFI